MEAIFQLMQYQKQDIIDTLESTLAPHVKLALDSLLPSTISMCHTPLPASNDKLKELIKKCNTISCEFKLFTLTTDSVITCKFKFVQQYTTLRVIGFELVQQIDLQSIQTSTRYY